MNLDQLYEEASKSGLPKKRLTGSEREALVNINMALDILMRSEEEIQNRLKTIPYGTRNMKTVITMLGKMLGYFAATIPTEQIKTYLNNLKMVSFTIGVKNPANLRKHDEDNYGMWLPYKTINELFAGCHDKCLMCGLDTEGQRRCSLRKALDSIPNDLAQNEGECPYYGEM